MNYFLKGFIYIALAMSFLVPQTSWSQVQGIGGTWYYGQKALNVEIYDDGWRFSVTDEAGLKSHGKAFNDSVIYLPSENITGQIEFEATIIEWSDGTYWAREAFTGEEPPGISE